MSDGDRLAMPTTSKMPSSAFRNRKTDPDSYLDNIRYKMSRSNTNKFIRNAIYINRHLIREKTILNIGCNIGCFSLVLAKAGASCVYAVDSSNAIDYAKEIIAANNYTNVIKIFKGDIKDIQLPSQVDVIVSDWFGFALLLHSSCDLVIYARDKWLKPGGYIIPDKGQLNACFFVKPDIRESRIDWWNNVLGFNMDAFRKKVLQEPVYSLLDINEINSNVSILKTINLNTDRLEDLRFTTQFKARVRSTGLIDGFCTFFNIRFSKSHTPIALNTDPWMIPTDWYHPLFFFDNALFAGKNQEFSCAVTMKSSYNPPNFDYIDLKMKVYKMLGDHRELEIDTVWHLMNKTVSPSPMNKTYPVNVHKPDDELNDDVIQIFNN